MTRTEGRSRGDNMKKSQKTSILCCPGPSQLGKPERPFLPVMGHEPASLVRGPASCELGMADADCEFITNQSLILLRSGRSSGPTGRLVAPEFGSTVTPLSHGCYREAHERRERRSGGSSSLHQGGVMATRILEGPVRSRGRMPCPLGHCRVVLRKSGPPMTSEPMAAGLSRHVAVWVVRPSGVSDPVCRT